MTALDDFFTHYYARRPVNATFTGVHAYDTELPDWSLDGTRIIFTQAGAGNCSFGLVDMLPDGGDVQLLSNPDTCATDISPAW